ncbi:MAG: hypothetical protein JW829_20530 [Pirellulales bacterium]|nr:hypothetical protein [Pirellulales bacterium]
MAVIYTRWDYSDAIYWIDIDGRRELLIADPEIACSQPIPLSSRPRPPILPRTVDYREETGIYYMQDIYAGPGLAGIPRGTIKKLRVVTIDFRAAGIGSNESYGPAGDSLSSTPVSIGNGCWDPKTILGDAVLHDDGSACFEVPSKTPVYFQALDASGYAVQTMRSWSTLQPGEAVSCVGCHESKNTAPLAGNVPTLAMAHGPQTLAPFHGSPRGFSFAQEIQPILDTHCIRCHSNSTPDPSAPVRQDSDKAAFSLLGRTVPDFQAKRRWSEAYLALTESTPKLDGGAYQGNPNGRWIRWISAQSEPNMLPPYHAGASRSPLMQFLDAGHEGVALNLEEKEKIAAWIDLLVPFCGNYTEGHLWNEDEFRLYEHFVKKRRRMQIIEQQNIRELIAQ